MVDDSRPTWPGNKPPGIPSSPPLGKRALALFIEGSERVLEDGELILGRSPSCDIVVDDMLASRVHAKLTISEGAVVLRDLGSSNGVYVNSMRIDMPTALRDGDRILIGTKEISVFAVRVGGILRRSSGMRSRSGSGAPLAPPIRGRTSEPRIPEQFSEPSPRTRNMQQAASDMPRTEKTDAFTHLGLLARRMIDSGRIEGAIRVLSEHMRNVLEGAREGRMVPLDVLQAASEFAMEFAEAQLEPKWVDYVVELHMNARRPMQAELIDKLCALRRKNVRCERDVLLFYKAALQREEPNFPLSQRVLCARIFSLGDDD